MADDERRAAAALQRIRDEGNLIGVSGAGHIRALIEWAEAVTAALDRVRDARGDDEEWQYTETKPHPNDPMLRTGECEREQGEDHETIRPEQPPPDKLGGQPPAEPKTP